MHYREFAPPPGLRAFVRCVWILEGHADETDGMSQPVLPDGRPELVIHFGDPFERVQDDGRIERQPAVLLAGQLAGQLMLRPTGRIAVLGIRFHPDGAANVVDIPQSELVGHTSAVEEVSPRLASVMAGARDAEAPSAAVDFVVSRLAACAKESRPDARVRAAVDAISRLQGNLSISALARATGVSCRQLERRFQQVVGISPKRLARIARFQQALHMLESPQSGNVMTATAAACGYADQAHFTRDFRDLAGCSPSAHLLRQAELTGFFHDRRIPAAR